MFRAVPGDIILILTRRNQRMICKDSCPRDEQFIAKVMLDDVLVAYAEHRSLRLNQLSPQRYSQIDSLNVGFPSACLVNLMN